MNESNFLRTLFALLGCIWLIGQLSVITGIIDCDGRNYFTTKCLRAHTQETPDG